MSGLGWQAWLTAGVIVAMVVALVREVARPDLILVGSLGLLLLAGVVSPEQAFSGFANTAVLTVGALFVVAAGVQRTQALSALDRLFFSPTGTDRSHTALVRRSLPRIMLCSSVLSAFLNNTPIVAMFIPRVQQWADRTGVASSKLLIPLSYAAIVGGMMTLIGTSTNIVVSGLLQAEGYSGLGMFDLTWVGAPAALGMLLYMTFAGHRLLPDRRQQGDNFGDGLKDCLFEA
ncbi:MAG TPA: SLC13 family permease, partial [Chloroflexota bacterium]|nr:SLC13 family permease [Chloroflexota bacterium]